MGYKRILTTLCLLALTLTIPAAFADNHEKDATAKKAGEAMSPTGYVWFSQRGIGLILGGSAGGGRLQYKGADYTFRISGISFGALGGLGTARLYGEVYGLERLEDFAGNYSETSSGISIISGGGEVWLENKHGVKMHLQAEATGVGINLSVGTVEVKLGLIDP